MEIRLLESARDDLRKGYYFYERQSPGLGDYFLSCLQTDILTLHDYAGIHERIDTFQRMLATRFPFAIYYEVENACIDIYAILDCRRDPNSNAGKLRASRKPHES